VQTESDWEDQTPFHSIDSRIVIQTLKYNEIKV
jgi:hypothetical protein